MCDYSLQENTKETNNIISTSIPGPFPGFQCCMLKCFSACNIGMGLGTRVYLKVIYTGVSIQPISFQALVFCCCCMTCNWDWGLAGDEATYTQYAN